MAGLPEYIEYPPHVELQQACDYEVEKVAQLVDKIKAGEEKRREQQNVVSHWQFTNENDFCRAQTYLKEINDWVSNSWQSIVDSTTVSVPQTFVNIFQWLRAQTAPLDEEIAKWKLKKRICLMGAPADKLNENLLLLKEKFEILEDLAVYYQKSIDRYLLIIDDLSKTYSHCEQFLVKCRQIMEEGERRMREAKSFVSALVKKGMIVYEEPPFVIRRSGNPNASRSQKHSRIPFNMEIRFLAGEKSGLLRANLEIEASLISEQQARDIVEGRANALNDLLPVGNIVYPVCTLHAPSPDNDGYLSAKINGARLQRVEKAAEDDASRVMYHIIFRAKMKRAANGSATYYPFWAISLPFSAVINANRQEPYKRALMFWQIAFAMDDKTSLSLPFDEKNEKTARIQWPDFFNALNLWFKNAPIGFEKHSDGDSNRGTKLQRGLDDHEQYVQEKIGLRQTADYMGNVVTWDMFYRRKSEATGLTFWEWIFGIAEFISKFPLYWDSGLVLGFASKNRVEKILATATEPSVVLKFSDSRPGKMVASYINWIPQGAVVEHVIFDEDDDPVFAGKTLIECIRRSAKLQYVKRILPVNKPIEDLYTLETAPPVKSNSKTRSDGYVKPGVLFMWGEPTPPVYQAEIRTPRESADSFADSVSSPQAAAPLPMFETNPVLQNWLNTPYIGSDSQFYQQQSYSNDGAQFSLDSTNTMNGFGITPVEGPLSFGELQTPMHQNDVTFQNSQEVEPQELAVLSDLMNDDIVDPDFVMSEYMQLK